MEGKEPESAYAETARSLEIGAVEYLKSLPRTWLPKSVERGIKDPSNSDLKRWLNMGAIVINGETPKAHDNITFPVKELVFFPKGKRKTTIIKE